MMTVMAIKLNTTGIKHDCPFLLLLLKLYYFCFGPCFEWSTSLLFSEFHATDNNRWSFGYDV